MLSIIVCFDKNKLIGKDNKIPWHYSEDLRYFKEVTWGKKVVMGSKTHESIIGYLHKPLPNRHHIVITRNPSKYPDIECYTSIEAFLEKYQNLDEEIFIIGGRQIYEQFLPYVDRLYITVIDAEHDGDTYFPRFNLDDFRLIKENKKGILNFTVYERKVK